jgi:membrane protein
MTYPIRKKIMAIPLARTSRALFKRVKLRKYGNLSLYRFLNIFFFNIGDDEIFDRANGVSYNMILATFPAIIFLFTLIPYVTVYYPAINSQSIMQFMGELMPPSMYDVASSTVLDIISNQRGGLLTFGFVFALFLATNGMMALMRAFNACYKTVDKRNVWRMRLTATALTIMLALVVFLAIALLVVGEVIINYVTTHLQDFSHFNLDSYTIYLFLALRFAVIFIVFFFTISFIYYFGPAVHYNWNFFSVGSWVATLGCLGVSYGFSYYVTNFGSYNKVYGSIGALIALMVWIQLLTVVLLFGYEINASLHYGMKLHEIDSFKKKAKNIQKAELLTPSSTNPQG